MGSRESLGRWKRDAEIDCRDVRKRYECLDRGSHGEPSSGEKIAELEVHKGKCVVGYPAVLWLEDLGYDG